MDYPDIIAIIMGTASDDVFLEHLELSPGAKKCWKVVVEEGEKCDCGRLHDTSLNRRNFQSLFGEVIPGHTSRVAFFKGMDTLTTVLDMDKLERAVSVFLTMREDYLKIHATGR